MSPISKVSWELGREERGGFSLFPVTSQAEFLLLAISSSMATVPSSHYFSCVSSAALLQCQRMPYIRPLLKVTDFYRKAEGTEGNSRIAGKKL